MESKAICFLEVAAGIIAGMLVWTYIQPMIASVTPVPTA